MTLLVFAPSRAPSPGSKRSSDHKKKSAGFGDDYTQEAPDGINPIVVSCDLVWDTLPISEGNAIEAFLTTVGSWTPFLYTYPNDVQRKYKFVPPLVRASSDSGIAETVSFSIKETHNP